MIEAAGYPLQDIYLELRSDTMVGYLVLSCVTLFLLFILFLVIGRTMNSIINLLIKTEYLLQKEHELKKEALDVRRMMEDQVNKLEKNVSTAH
jgi:hypothetical protein